MMHEFALRESHEYGEPRQTVKANLARCAVKIVDASCSQSFSHGHLPAIRSRG